MSEPKLCKDCRFALNDHPWAETTPRPWPTRKAVRSTPSSSAPGCGGCHQPRLSGAVSYHARGGHRGRPPAAVPRLRFFPAVVVVCVVSGRLVTIAALRSPERRCPRQPATRPGHRPPRQARAPLLFIGAPRRLWPRRALLAGGPALAASAARCPAPRWATAGFGRLCSVALPDLAGPLISSHRRQRRDRSRAPGFGGAPVDVEAAADLAPDAVLDDKPEPPVDTAPRDCARHARSRRRHRAWHRRALSVTDDSRHRHRGATG